MGLVLMPARMIGAHGLESNHRPQEPLDGPVVLLDDVAEALRLTQLDLAARVGLNVLNRRDVGAALLSGLPER